MICTPGGGDWRGGEYHYYEYFYPIYKRTTTTPIPYPILYSSAYKLHTYTLPIFISV